MSQSQQTEATTIQAARDGFREIVSEDGVKENVALTPERHRWSAHTSTTSLGGYPERLSASPSMHKKLPPVEGDSIEYKRFRTLCDAVLREVRSLKSAPEDSELADGWMTTAAEIEALVQDLYDVVWGEKDALKRVVVKLESQINNANWDHRHVSFLEDVFTALRNRYSIDNTTVVEVANLVKSHQLPLFRGTLSADNQRKQFKLIEVESQMTDE